MMTVANANTPAPVQHWYQRGWFRTLVTILVILFLLFALFQWIVPWVIVRINGYSSISAPSAIVDTEVVCKYDYNFLPQGKDKNGVPLADYGVALNGKVAGPALVQTDSLTVVAVYPGQTWEGSGIAWRYVGDNDCLEAQFQFFKNREIVKVK